MKKPELSVSPAFVIAACAFCYADRLGLFVPFFLSAGLHEAAHLMMLYFFRIPVTRIDLHLTGTVIHTDLPNGLPGFCILAAGPAINLIAAAAARRLWPELCLCSAVLCLYNLLPVRSLDGGRICALFLPGSVCAILEILTVLCVAAAGICASVFGDLGILPCLLAGMFLLRLPKGLVKSGRGW